MVSIIREGPAKCVGRLMLGNGLMPLRLDDVQGNGPRVDALWAGF
jgi:hypothetical protein